MPWLSGIWHPKEACKLVAVVCTRVGVTEAQGMPVGSIKSKGIRRKPIIQAPHIYRRLSANAFGLGATVRACPPYGSAYRGYDVCRHPWRMSYSGSLTLRRAIKSVNRQGKKSIKILHRQGKMQIKSAEIVRVLKTALFRTFLNYFRTF